METTAHDVPVRILLVDDDEDDFVLTRDLLADIPDTNIQLDWVADPAEALKLICANEYDLYLIDYRLGPTTGVDLIRQAQDSGCFSPMILLTGMGERSLDYEAMLAGAADYLEKDKLDAVLLERSIRYSLQQKRHAAELERKVQMRTAELAQANEALREADRRKDEFLATLAHELRNPLAPIRNALEIMRLAGDRTDILESNRAMIERQVKLLVRLVDDLLDISRISRGTIRLHKERVNIAGVVETAIEGARPEIDRARHELTVTMPDEDCFVYGDPTRLSQILLNLLNNAAKYTGSGGHIQLQVAKEADQLAIRVRDDGIGIAADLLPRVFDMFIQMNHGPDHPSGGLGIGLSLVQNLVQLHGGSVEVSSEGPGKGTEFTVRLPLAPSSPMEG